MSIKCSILLACAFIMLSGCSKNHTLPYTFIDTWTGDDTATSGIIGHVILTPKTIRFGNNGSLLKPPSCSANYTVKTNKRTHEYTLTLKNKTCDYKNALNPGWLKPMNTLTVYMSKKPFGKKTAQMRGSNEPDASTPYLFIQSAGSGSDFRLFRDNSTQ